MTRIRFSLLGLVGATTAIAVGCAALVYASTTLAGIVWSATLLILAFGQLSAVLADPVRRGFWIGFAMCGWLYVLITFGPFSGLAELTSLPALLNRAAWAMPQAKGVDEVAISVGRPPAGMPGADFSAKEILAIEIQKLNADLYIASRSMKNAEYVESFVQTAHALITLLLAAIGGWVGQVIRGRQSKV